VAFLKSHNNIFSPYCLNQTNCLPRTPSQTNSTTLKLSLRIKGTEFTHQRITEWKTGETTRLCAGELIISWYLEIQ